MRKVHEKLNRNYILQRVSEEEIFSRFFGISLSVIYDCVKNNNLICSPIRVDKNPTVGFYYKNNRLYCNDFAGYFHGDCFDAVIEVTSGIFHNDSASFPLSIEEIAKEFQLHTYSNKSKIERTPTHISVDKEKKELHIHVNPRQWNNYDYNYWWNKYNFSFDHLNNNYVFAVGDLFINEYCIYRYHQKDPAYAYYFGKDVNDRQIWKIYFPKRKKGLKKYPRFISNNNWVQGGKLLKNCEHLCIIKSYKDVLAIKLFQEEFGIDSLAPPAESVLLKTNEMDYVRSKSNNIFTWSDPDRTGILFGLRMKRFYNTTPFFLTNGYYNTIDFKTKDLTDYIEKYGIDKSRYLIESILQNNYQHTLQFKDDMKNIGHYDSNIIFDNGNIPF